MSDVPPSTSMGSVISARSSSEKLLEEGEIGMMALTRGSGGMSWKPVAMANVVKPPKEWPATPIRRGSTLP